MQSTALAAAGTELYVIDASVLRAELFNKLNGGNSRRRAANLAVRLARRQLDFEETCMNSAAVHAPPPANEVEKEAARSRFRISGLMRQLATDAPTPKKHSLSPSSSAREDKGHDTDEATGSESSSKSSAGNEGELTEHLRARATRVAYDEETSALAIAEDADDWVPRELSSRAGEIKACAARARSARSAAFARAKTVAWRKEQCVTRGTQMSKTQETALITAWQQAEKACREACENIVSLNGRRSCYMRQAEECCDDVEKNLASLRLRGVLLQLRASRGSAPTTPSISRRQSAVSLAFTGSLPSLRW